MFVRDSVYSRLVEFVMNDDFVGLKFFLRWERDRRSYLHHRNNDGLTLLHQACLLGKRKIVHALVECGCDIEGRSSIGWTALHAAALSGCYDVVAYLVNTCASNVIAKDELGCKPIDLTLEPQITALLHEKTEEFNARTAEEMKNFRKTSETALLVYEKERLQTYHVSEATGKGRIENCPDRNKKFLKYIRFRDDDSDRLSLRSGHAVNRTKSYRRMKVVKLKDDDFDRDSGIYEDFADTGDVTVRDNVLKKPSKNKFVPIYGKSTHV